MQEASKMLPTFLFIKYLDDLVYINCNDIQGELKKGGREKRVGSTNDKEFLVFVNKNKFKKYIILN